MTAEDPKDLVCLVADKNTEQSILTSSVIRTSTASIHSR
jgi:hypothetical protein